MNAKIAMVTLYSIVKKDIKLFNEITGDAFKNALVDQEQLDKLYEAGFVVFSKSEETKHFLKGLGFVHKDDDCIESFLPKPVNEMSVIVKREWRKANKCQ